MLASSPSDDVNPPKEGIPRRTIKESLRNEATHRRDSASQAPATRADVGAPISPCTLRGDNRFEALQRRGRDLTAAGLPPSRVVPMNLSPTELRASSTGTALS